MKRLALLLGGVAALQLAGCMDEEVGTSEKTVPSFEEFESRTTVDIHGMYIVDGDIPINGRKNLREFYDRVFHPEDALIVDTMGPGGPDDKWAVTQRKQLTYCIGPTFDTTNKNLLIDAMQKATDQGWERWGDVDFIYKPSEDANCNPSNNNVLFDVNQVSGQPFLARAFFPASPRAQRNVLVDTSSFVPDLDWPLYNILTHELGHSLGFRHEQDRDDTIGKDTNGEACKNLKTGPNPDWHLTTYDAKSIMNYCFCEASSDLSEFDVLSVQALYGRP